jgi:DNA-binding PadR family transcriptional regulator
LVKARWAPSENNRRARYYELTKEGKQQLAVEQTEWERFAFALGLILEAE